MSGTSPVFIKQLLPAVVLTAAGALVLGHLSQPVSAPSAAALGEAAVNAEAIFTSTPRQIAEEPKPAHGHAHGEQAKDRCCQHRASASAGCSRRPASRSWRSALDHAIGRADAD